MSWFSTGFIFKSWCHIGYHTVQTIFKGWIIYFSLEARNFSFESFKTSQVDIPEYLSLWNQFYLVIPISYSETGWTFSHISSLIKKIAKNLSGISVFFLSLSCLCCQNCFLVVFLHWIYFKKYLLFPLIFFATWSFFIPSYLSPSPFVPELVFVSLRTGFPFPQGRLLNFYSFLDSTREPRLPCLRLSWPFLTL